MLASSNRPFQPHRTRFDTADTLAYNGGNFAEETAVADNETASLHQLQERLDLLDRRLDNIDSMVTAVAERVMNQPITLNITCPRCGRNIEIAVLGSQKPTR